MSVDNFRIIVKPNGVLLVGVVSASIGGFLFAQKLNHPSPTAKPVGGVNAAPAAPAPAPEDDMTPGEREEKQLLRDWTQAKDQARDWLLLGPLDAGSEIRETVNSADTQAQMDRIINKVYLPQEAKYEAKENVTVSLAGTDYTWRKVNGSAFDFKEIFTSSQMPMNRLKNVVVYAVTYIDSPKNRRKMMHFRSDDGAIVWLNGDQVFKTTKIRGVRDEDVFPVHLRAGRNTLLIKVGQGTGGWGMMAHLENPK